jgi:ATP synthase protein I
MSDEPAAKTREKAGKKTGMQGPAAEGEPEFSRRIKVKAARKLRAREAQGRDAETAWSGLGMIGLVGWGVSVPTLLGAALGIWLDRRFPGEHSWTLTLLFAGLVIGCLNAWRWITREERITRKDEEQKASDGRK